MHTKDILFLRRVPAVAAPKMNDSFDDAEHELRYMQKTDYGSLAPIHSVAGVFVNDNWSHGSFKCRTDKRGDISVFRKAIKSCPSDFSSLQSIMFGPKMPYRTPYTHARRIKYAGWAVRTSAAECRESCECFESIQCIQKTQATIRFILLMRQSHSFNFLCSCR